MRASHACEPCVHMQACWPTTGSSRAGHQADEADKVDAPSDEHVERDGVWVICFGWSLSTVHQPLPTGLGRRYRAGPCGGSPSGPNTETLEESRMVTSLNGLVGANAPIHAGIAVGQLSDRPGEVLPLRDHAQD